MAGIERARAHGLDVGAICTFTAGSVAHAPEIFDFFVREGLNFSVHAALPSLRYPEADRWSITPDAHGELLAGHRQIGRVRPATRHSPTACRVTPG
jgi:uncharacterized protein